MLPHNQLLQGTEFRNRRIKFVIFMGTLALISYAFSQSEENETQTNNLHHCASVSGNREILSFIFNSTQKPSPECYLFQVFSLLSQKHFKGLKNETYTHLHIFQLNQMKPEFNISVYFSSSKYLDDPQQQFEFSLNIIEYAKILENATIIELKNSDQTDCNNQIKLQINNVKNNLNISFAESIDIEIQLQTECQQITAYYQGQVKDNSTEIELQVISYSFLNTVVCLCCMVYGLRILRALLDGQENAEEYSMLSIGFIMAQDLFLCFLNFFQAMQSERLFQYYITPSFLQFLLFSIFEMRILMIIWKGTILENQSFRNQVIKFYGTLYICMFITMYLIYNYAFSPWLQLLLSFYLVPQIIHIAKRGQVVRFNYKFIFGFLLPRILYFFYFRLNPNNLFQLKPMPILLLFIVFFVVIQIGIHFLQNEWGPQFFIPKICLPNKFNYYQKIPSLIDLEEGPSSEQSHLFQQECAICMGILHMVPNDKLSEQEERNFLIKQAMKNSKNHYMKTPCEHKFHVQCLVKWMTIKLTCPSCRQVLPPF